MSFIASVFSAIIDIVVAVVDIIVQIVEVIIEIIMVLLGYDADGQTIEYFEVRNIPLFEEPDGRNPHLESIIKSILGGTDISKDLLYNLTFRSMKRDVKSFMDFIDDGNYFEGFPDIESYIIYVDYDELDTAIETQEGVACTIEQAYVRALDRSTWIKYWLQENKTYDVGANRLVDLAGHETTSTTAATPAADTVNVTPSANHYDVAITSEVTTEDAVDVEARWQIDFTSIVYNSGPDNYSVDKYNDAGDTATLSYTIPSKPTQLHYISYYYHDSAPSLQYLFVYKLGTGTYVDLDTVEDPLSIDGSSLQALPAIPLRISNVDYTSFGASKADAIEDICDLINLDAAEILDAIKTDSDLAPGDLDHIYITFGVRMWDTSQIGMTYLFNMFENLYAAQSVTKGLYDAAPAGDDKPVNNIITETDDNKYLFQFNYITYEHTTLAAIDADTGSVENGIYYSDMSKFNADGDLVYPYFVSSGKGTYNVGYKADNLDEVQDFLDGVGVVNPGDTSAEAANWLQVTTRLPYNNTTPVLQDPDGTTSDLIYLTPDLVYENNGSGVLRVVNNAAEETTSGQSITYYKCTASGLDAYTVAAPVAALKVIDGDSGYFRMVKFNLGSQDDLMVPFIHTFVKDLSNKDVTQLFLAGAHASIYIAHYEVIEPAGFSFLIALVLIVIIIVVIIFAPQIAAKLAAFVGELAAAAAAAATVYGAISAVAVILLPVVLKTLVIQLLTKYIITEVAGQNEELAMVLGLVAAVVAVSYTGAEGATEFQSLSDFSVFDIVKVAFAALNNYNTVNEIKVKRLEEELELDYQEFSKDAALRQAGLYDKIQILESIQEDLYAGANDFVLDGLRSSRRANLNPLYPEHMIAMYDGTIQAQYVNHDISTLIDMQVSREHAFI